MSDSQNKVPAPGSFGGFFLSALLCSSVAPTHSQVTSAADGKLQTVFYHWHLTLPHLNTLHPCCHEVNPCTTKRLLDIYLSFSIMSQAHSNKPTSCYVSSTWVFSAHSKIDCFICLPQQIRIKYQENRLQHHKQKELKCIYFSLNVLLLLVGLCRTPSFLCALVGEWGKKANKSETEMQTWNSAAQTPPDTS